MKGLVSTRSIAGALTDIVGREGVVGEPATLAVDGVAPRWAVRVIAAEQVSAILALASEESLAVVPRGSGSALELGFPPTRVDLVIDLRGMDRIVDYNPDDLTVSVEAGLTAGALAARLASRRQLLPIDPPGVASRTVGGLVATAAHGPLRARYGTLRDAVLGVRFVQADGVLTWGGARVVKSVSGYDVPKLMVGSLGTLGVICELTLRLHPKPDAEASRLVSFDAPAAARAFVARLLDSSVEPNRVEFLNGAALGRLGLDARGPAAVAVSIGSLDVAVQDEMATVDGFAREIGGRSESLPMSFWETYATMIVEAGRALALHVSAPTSDLAAAVRCVEDAMAELAPGEPAIVVGCAALGTLDVLVAEPAVAVAARLVERVRAVMAEIGGHAMLRRASPAVRRTVDPWGPVAPGAMALMRALRDELDPRRVLNPGRFVGGL